MDIFPGITDPLDYGLAVLLFGGWIGLLWMVRLIFKGDLCSGRELKAVQDDRDEWKNVALRALGVASRTTSATEALRDIAAVLPDPVKGKEGL